MPINYPKNDDKHKLPHSRPTWGKIQHSTAGARACANDLSLVRPQPGQPCPRSRHIGFSRTFLPIFGATQTQSRTQARLISDLTRYFLGSWNIGFINIGRGWVLWKLFRALDGSCDLSHSQQGCGLAPGPEHKIMQGGPDRIRVKQCRILTRFSKLWLA